MSAVNFKVTCEEILVSFVSQVMKLNHSKDGRPKFVQKVNGTIE